MKRFIALLAPCLLAAPVLAAPTNAASSADTGWVVNANLGLAEVDNATNSRNVNFLGSLDRTHKGVDAIHFDAGYFYNQQKLQGAGSSQTTDDYKFLEGRYDRFLSDKLAVYVDGKLRIDRPDNVDLRQFGGLGLSYLAVDDDMINWTLSAGAGYLAERYTDGSQSKSNTVLQFGSKITAKLAKNLTLSDKAEYIPQPSNFSNYYFNSVLQLDYKLSDAFSLTFSNVADFDAQPPAGSLMKSNTWFLGLNYKSTL